ncbi:MAG: acetamidase/formamidase family protein [Eubacteriales bacterium]|nr:acetamidase/formamidase family protein [Eubacteriales bacterium]
MKVSTDQIIYHFTSSNCPVLTVPSGSIVEFDTYDCFSNQLRTEKDKMESLDWDRINPATGPIYIEGAEPGDILKVTINRIEIDSKGTIVSGEELGILGGILKGAHTKIIPIQDGKAQFSDGIRIPIKPMIGVIGVAPKDGEINTGTPGKHGGNMDNRMVAEGATLYFHVETPGALFALGDVHGVMGDGEIGVSGLEIPAKITVTLEIVKGRSIQGPMLENSEHWTVIESAETIEDAVQEATENMFRFLSGRMNLKDPEIAMLMSLVGQLEFCQVVDPLKTVRFTMPKKYLGEISL